MGPSTFSYNESRVLIKSADLYFNPGEPCTDFILLKLKQKNERMNELSSKFDLLELNRYKSSRIQFSRKERLLFAIVISLSIFPAN